LIWSGTQTDYKEKYEDHLTRGSSDTQVGNKKHFLYLDEAQEKSKERYGDFFVGPDGTNNKKKEARDTPFKLKQQLSPKASAAKKKRDIEYAKSPARKHKKAQNQRLGQRSDSDLHHSGSSVRRVSIKNNRGNFGNGTKNE